jgi:hypothetical protein
VGLRYAEDVARFKLALPHAAHVDIVMEDTSPNYVIVSWLLPQKTPYHDINCQPLLGQTILDDTSGLILLDATIEDDKN